MLMDQLGQYRELSHMLVASTINDVLKLESKLLGNLDSPSCPLESFTSRLNQLRSTYIEVHHPLCLVLGDDYSVANVMNIINEDCFSRIAHIKRDADNAISFNISSTSFSSDLQKCVVGATVAYTALLIQEIQQHQRELNEELDAEPNYPIPDSVSQPKTVCVNGKPAPVLGDGIDDSDMTESALLPSLRPVAPSESHLSVDGEPRIEAETDSGDNDFDQKIDEFIKINDVSSDALETDLKKPEKNADDQDAVEEATENVTISNQNGIDAGTPSPAATIIGIENPKSDVADAELDTEVVIYTTGENNKEIKSGDFDASDRIPDSAESLAPAFGHEMQQPDVSVPPAHDLSSANKEISEVVQDDDSKVGSQDTPGLEGLKGVDAQTSSMRPESKHDGDHILQPEITELATRDLIPLKNDESTDMDQSEKAACLETIVRAPHEEDQMIDNHKKRTAPTSFNTQQQKRFQGIATRLITSIQEHRFSLPFLQPVNPRDAPDYTEMIYEPRDLKNILRLVKLKSDQPVYTSIKHLKRDIMLMCANCIMYNKSSDDLARLTISMRDDVKAIFKMYEEAELEI